MVRNYVNIVDNKPDVKEQLTQLRGCVKTSAGFYILKTSAAFNHSKSNAIFLFCYVKALQQNNHCSHHGVYHKTFMNLNNNTSITNLISLLCNYEFVCSYKQFIKLGTQLFQFHTFLIFLTFFCF